MIHLLYANQGEEGSGWVTDNLLASVGRAVPGLNVEKALAASDSHAEHNQVQANAVVAEDFDVTGTPSFAAGPTGGVIKKVDISSLDSGALRPTLDSLLTR